VSFQQRAWAGVLWSGGVVSHRTAAPMWDLPGGHVGLTHVTVARPFQTTMPGVRLHRVGLPPGETTTIDGLPVTTCARTVIDLLRVERYPAARDLLDRGRQRGWVDVDSIDRALVAGRGRTGNVQLRKLLAGIEPGADAESERRLHRLLRQAGISGWVPQYRIRLAHAFAYIDVAFPAQKLAIEVDGRRYHDIGSDQFESDRARQNELQALGWQVLRFTWRMLLDDSEAIVTKINQLLRAPIRQDAAV
jgi:very-short-patch-repair endonuclease